MDQIQENEIIQLVQKGNRDAYALIVEKYKNPVFNLAYRMTGNYQDADDLAQETFIKAYEAINRFDINKQFFPWLFTIGINLIRNHLKKQNLILSKTGFEQNNPAKDNPEQAVIRHQETERLNYYLQKLPFELRAAVILRYYQEMPFDEVSKILGISLSAAKMRVYRGLEKLKELVRD